MLGVFDRVVWNEIFVGFFFCNFLKYIKVKKCVEMYISLFEMWKLLLRIPNGRLPLSWATFKNLRPSDPRIVLNKTLFYILKSEREREREREAMEGYFDLMSDVAKGWGVLSWFASHKKQTKSQPICSTGFSLSIICFYALIKLNYFLY